MSKLDWAQRLSIFSRVNKLNMLFSQIQDLSSDMTEIYIDLPSFWPKEYDFEDLKYTVYSKFKSHEFKEVRDELVKLIRNLEHFYQTKNILFDLDLQQLRASLRGNDRKTTIYQKRLEQWISSQDLVVSGEQKDTTTIVKISVPVNKFIIGEFTQRFWISDQRFNNYAHLRVQDISVSIDGIPDSLVNEHLKIQPLTSILYDIDASEKQLVYSSIPTEYPLVKETNAVTPFTLWRFNPDSVLVSKIHQKEMIQVKMTFSMTGVFVEGLDGRADDDCLQYDNDPEKFSDCKYGGVDPFYLMYDIVNVMHLREVNNLFALKYENQLKNGTDEGVVTHIDTDWSEEYGFGCQSTPFGDFITKYKVKVESTLQAPKMSFPPTLPGYMELLFEMEESTVTKEINFYDCDTEEHIGESQTQLYELNAGIKLTISLEKVTGNVGEEEVSLDLASTAIEGIEFSPTDPLDDDAILTIFKQSFTENFSAVQLATIKYDPAFKPPEFVQPSKFFFQTVSTACLGCSIDEIDGYLITVYQTKSQNHIDLGYPSDPHNTYGLDHAIPAQNYTAGVFLGAHIAFCDVYYESFRNASEVQDLFTVTKKTSSKPDKPQSKELYIEYR